MNQELVLFFNFSTSFSMDIKQAKDNSADSYNSSVVFSSMSGGTTTMKFPLFGQKFGEITIAEADINDFPVIQGDGMPELRNGIGHFFGSYLPGQGNKIVLSAHNTTYFKNLGKVKLGNTIVFDTTYGVYKYKVYDIKIVSENDTQLVAAERGKEYLVLYTCYPFEGLGHKDKRIAVYASFESGPSLVE
jgi:sortase A